MSGCTGKALMASRGRLETPNVFAPNREDLHMIFGQGEQRRLVGGLTISMPDDWSSDELTFPQMHSGEVTRFLTDIQDA